MPECEYTSICSFFNDMLPNMPTMADTLKRKYCEGERTDCARYIYAIGVDMVTLPVDLFPSDRERAQKLVDAKKVPDEEGRPQADE